MEGSTEAAITQPVAPVQSWNAALDEKNRFRIFHLGSPMSEFAGMMKNSRLLSDEKICDVEDFDKKIGNAELSGIRLIFSQDILKQIYVLIDGKQNELGFKEALIAAYGQPVSKDSFSGKTLVWEGNKTKLVLEIGISSHAIFTNKDVTARIDKLIEQKAKAGAAAGAKSL